MDDGERPTSSPTTSPIDDEMSSPTTSPTTVEMKCLNYMTFILENTDDDDDDDDKIIINSLKVAKCPQLHSVAFWLCLRRQTGRPTSYLAAVVYIIPWETSSIELDGYLVNFGNRCKQRTPPQKKKIELCYSWKMR